MECALVEEHWRRLNRYFSMGGSGKLLANEFVELLTEHQGLLWTYILSMLPGDKEAEDILQNTNIALWKKRNQFKKGTNFKAWCFAVARFEVLNHRKKRSRDRLTFLDDELLETMSVEHVQFIDKDDFRMEGLGICINGLQKKHRELLNHRYGRRGGLTEYSRQTGRSMASLSVTLNRLRRHLRICVSKYLVRRGGVA